ncbi:CBS domain containing-hemolysin-like protein [Aequitasia blattaphilus]|uniref:Hemolysin family protein n=1 Tax=Aequitasia blattaphilus TaxID=2949332 RepID=A0ABT1ECT9_9FIRM|nr:hemolysin family protein [Aequitasia blattaphilus]MCP1103643.1 hemolysin family protein [Aequitasia blattaphilus]MCR8616283.1 hemolysin family protein [Aequitasia blattaphilus]
MISLDPSSIGKIIALIILLLLSAFFSSAETALTTSNKIRLRGLANEGNKKASTVLNITERPSKMLSAILIGNNIVNVGAASLTTAISYDFGGKWIALGSGIITLLILIFGEITPKTLASIYADGISLRYSSIISIFMKITTPVIFVINSISKLILRIFGVRSDAKNDTLTETELRTILHVSQEDGVIEDQEKEMIYNVFDLGDAKAKDVMVPRVHVVFADVNSTYEELISLFREDKFTRLPVFEDTTDNVIGIINMKDLLLYDNVREFSIRDILRDTFFTYEYKNISELLIEMRDSSFNMAIVLDEYGETSGLITLEDILEEIVGEIRDEYDDNEEDIVTQVEPREYLAEGSANLDDLNEALNTAFESDDYDSIGGYIMEHLDRLPETGDELETSDYIRLKVESMDKNRIEKVRIFLPENLHMQNKE